MEIVLQKGSHFAHCLLQGPGSSVYLDVLICSDHGSAVSLFFPLPLRHSLCQQVVWCLELIIDDFYFLSLLTSHRPLFGAGSMRSLVGTNTCQIFAGSYLSLGLAQAGSEFLAPDISPPLSIPLSSLRAFLSSHSF